VPPALDSFLLFTVLSGIPPDPHSLHCHECGIAAEFGLRGSKEGGGTRYLCSAHSAFNGCFCIDKDRAGERSGRPLLGA
jgi:hypothetical protein